MPLHHVTCLSVTLIYVSTQNLTVHMPADLVRQAKIVAAKRGTSVSALLRTSLEEIVASEDEYIAAGERFLASPVSYEFKKDWTREDLHERR